MPKKLEFSPSISILVAGALIAGAIVFVNMRPGAAATADGGALPGNAAVPAPSASDHIIGSPDAPIVLIEYSDFQCAYCSMVYPTIKKIVEESNGQIAWVMRNLPLDSIHPEARPAALAAECIAEQKGSEGWWRFADAMFADQSKVDSAGYLAEAKNIGVDMAQYLSCVSARSTTRSSATSPRKPRSRARRARPTPSCTATAPRCRSRAPCPRRSSGRL